MKVISTETAPAAIGPYSQAIVTNSLFLPLARSPSILRPALLPVTSSTLRLSRAARTSPPSSPLPEAT